MRFINFLTILIISSILLNVCSFKKQITPLEELMSKDEVIIGVKEDSKPFGYLEEGIYKGFDVDVATEVFNKLFIQETGEEKKITFTPVSAQDKIMKLNSKEVDFIVAIMSITPSREKVVDFTIPYFIAGQAVMVKKGSDVRTVEDLNGKDVVVILGTTGERALRQLAPNAIIKGCKNYKDAFELLKKGETKAVYGDDSVLYGIIMDNKDYKILNKRYTKEFYAIAFRKEKGNNKLKAKLNLVLEEMQKSGELAKIKQKWIPTETISK